MRRNPQTRQYVYFNQEVILKSHNNRILHTYEENNILQRLVLVDC